MRSICHLGLTPHLLGLVLIFVSTKQKLKKKTFVRRLTFFQQKDFDMRQELSIIEIIFPYIRALLHTQAVYASTSHTLSFSYIFIGEANKNIDSAKDVRAQARENFGV